ncbi:TrmH family RNA methyltransferase [Rhizobium paknamense]|uniref:tRNA G18 (Ribose-2'-O)-methylase SpoU n=1 Tax=Rhizobium paknamense TaxID=1206817 RepID=A0ABU0IFS3_9HYPH|nr:RNA methyltransferase [Rhizobium paknamense]MDQ0457112.1 tRNA G18 (ribose-2'-O)-methylase SpoU [Rhizobium paknamense]
MTHSLRITDPDDPRIAAFRQIRERDLVGREGRFIAEGTVVLRLLLAAHRAGQGIRAEKLLLLENRLAGLESLLADLPEEIEVYTASQPVLDAVAGFHLHRGVLGLGRREAVPSFEDMLAELPARALILVGCGISNHDNVGAMFRNAAAFEADAVLLDETSCDPFYRKALRVSVGSVLAVPHLRQGESGQLLRRLDEEGFQILPLSPSGTVEIGDIQPAWRVALVVGTEGEGLPADILSRFQPVRIAQSSRLDSLNLGTASGIALHAIARGMGKV